jgi:hypothetical protein
MFRHTPWIAACMLLSSASQADWWIEATDLSQKADLQLLSDYGLIRQPLTSYPLFWAGIRQDLDQLDQSQLNTELLLAVRRLQQNWQQQRPVTGQVQLHAATEQDLYKSFGENYTDKAVARAELSFQSDHFSGRLTGSYHATDSYGGRSRLDHSYLATRLGNWVLTAGRLDQFWGPSWDSSTIMSHHARPLPGISLSRYNSNADSWLSSVTGPWTFTSRFAQMEQLPPEDIALGAISNARLWSSRASIRPVRQLELGFSWAMMWGGDGYGNTLADWYHGLFRGGSLEGHENMLAGYDARYSDIWFERPVGFYMMATSEDFNRQKYKLTKVSYQLGADIYLSEIKSRLYLEFTGNNAYCNDVENNNCLYEHSKFRQGYRSYRQSIGSTYDNDALVLQLGLIRQLENGASWQHKVARIRLNVDGTDRPLPGGNPLSRGEARQQYQWQQIYQHSTSYGDFQLGTDLLYTDKSSTGTHWDNRFFVNWSQQF